MTVANKKYIINYHDAPFRVHNMSPLNVGWNLCLYYAHVCAGWENNKITLVLSTQLPG